MYAQMYESPTSIVFVVFVFCLVWFRFRFPVDIKGGKNPRCCTEGELRRFPPSSPSPLPVPAPNMTHAYCPADRSRERFYSSLTQGIRGGANPVFRESLVCLVKALETRSSWESTTRWPVTIPPCSVSRLAWRSLAALAFRRGCV